jgi:hypothetical protein
MLHLVDTVEVEPDHVDDYLDVLRTLGLPIMIDAGAAFVSCGTTSKLIGEPVSIQVVWAFADHEQWNEIRRQLVLDPRWYEYGARAASLRVGGTRRFYAPASISSPSRQ